MLKTARFSKDHTRRFILDYTWDRTKTTLLFIGLNPSLASEEKSDPTITRVINFAKSWGMGRLLVGNLYSWVTPYPEECSLTIVKEDNDVLLEMADKSNIILLGWGAYKKAKNRAKNVLKLLYDYELSCLGKNKDGSPKHPLYLPKTTKLREYYEYPSRNN